MAKCKESTYENAPALTARPKQSEIFHGHVKMSEPSSYTLPVLCATCNNDAASINLVYGRLSSISGLKQPAINGRELIHCILIWCTCNSVGSILCAKRGSTLHNANLHLQLWSVQAKYAHV
jgi:hypothetical protein